MAGLETATSGFRDQRHTTKPQGSVIENKASENIFINIQAWNCRILSVPATRSLLDTKCMNSNSSITEPLNRT